MILPRPVGGTVTVPYIERLCDSLEDEIAALKQKRKELEEGL